MKWAAPCDEDSQAVNVELEDVVEGGEPNGGNETSQRIQNETKVTHHVAKKTQVATVTSINNDFGANDFLMHFNAFLRMNQVPNVATISTHFPIYKRVRLKLPPIPEVSSHAVVDTVHCTKAIPQNVTNRGIKEGSPAKFSTVLVRYKKADPALGPMDGEIRSFYYKLVLTLCLFNI